MRRHGPPAAQLYLMRHALTTWNLAGRIQGQDDSPLAPAGWRQVERWSRRLSAFNLTRIIASDSGRAHTTAKAIGHALGLPVVCERRLREQDWGAWTGRTHAQLKAAFGAAYRRETQRGWDFRPPGGESHLEVLARALEVALEIGRAHPGARLLVVTHEGWMKCLLYHLAIRDGCGHSPPTVAAYHLHRIVSDGGHIDLDALNLCALDPEGSP
jgi:broad specificity phosphatase PhoE